MNSAETVLLERIHATIDRIEGHSVDLHAAINNRLHLFPAPVQHSVRQGWDDFCTLMRRIWDNLATIVSNMGSLSALSDTAQAWSDRVGVPVSGQVQAADAGLLTVDDNWDGAAADTYRQMLPLQKAALEKIKTTITDGMATALGQVHLGILVFWTSLATALVSLSVGIFGALASTATIVGIPAAPVIAAGAAVTASLALIAGCETLKACCTSANTTLRQKFDDTSFYQGHWPPAGTQ